MRLTFSARRADCGGNHRLHRRPLHRLRSIRWPGASRIVPASHRSRARCTSGPTKFRVLPADPDAAKKPRTASNPGRYTLGENARLVVSRRPVGARIVNEASIQFFSGPGQARPGEPHEIKLPDGYNTWAAAWVRGGTCCGCCRKRNPQLRLHQPRQGERASHGTRQSAARNPRSPVPPSQRRRLPGCGAQVPRRLPPPGPDSKTPEFQRRTGAGTALASGTIPMPAAIAPLDDWHASR